MTPPREPDLAAPQGAEPTQAEPAGASEGSSTMGPPRSNLARLRELGHTVLASLVLAVVVRVGIAQAYEVDGPSMEPTLVSGEKLLVARCAYGLALPGVTEQVVAWALPDVGDVVILASPQDPDEDLVKRVVGLPGDVIEVRQDVVYRNGQRLLLDGPHACAPGRFAHRYPECQTYREAFDGETWNTTHSYVGWDQTLPPARVPPGHLYVMGDHRTRSNDSRSFGPVPASLLRGQVLFVD